MVFFFFWGGEGVSIHIPTYVYIYMLILIYISTICIYIVCEPKIFKVGFEILALDQLMNSGGT